MIVLAVEFTSIMTFLLYASVKWFDDAFSILSIYHGVWIAVSYGVFKMPSLSFKIKNKIFFRADVIFEITCIWSFSRDSCVIFEDDLKFEAKIVVKLFVIIFDRSELWSDLRIKISNVVTLEEFLVNVSFSFSTVCGAERPGRQVKLISDSTKWKQKRKNCR